jgi:ubiquitin-conjugating enzyme E2 S
MSSLSSKAVKKIVKELQGLKENPPEDIQLAINDQDLSEIIAWIRGPGKEEKQRYIETCS